MIGEVLSAALRRWPLLAAAALVLWLSGCGFHLRGSFEIPQEVNPAYVQAPESSELAQELRHTLRLSSVEVVPEPQQARAKIRILDESFKSRVLSVDGTGKVIEKELRYRVEFDVTDTAGAALLPRQVINVARAQINPDVEVLGKQQEETLIRRDMQQDISGRILRRIQAQLR